MLYIKAGSERAKRVRLTVKIRALGAAVLVLASALCACSRGGTQTPSGQAQDIAMGSAISVSAYGGSKEAAHSLCVAACDAVQALDTRVLSKTASSSELYRLNHTDEAERPVTVSSELFDALAETKAIYAYSGGKAALGCGALTSLWGMDTDEFRVPAQEEIDAARALCSDDTVQLDAENNTVSFAPGQELNLGSTGKGLGCDRAAQVLREAVDAGTITGGIVSVGGSIAAVGSSDGEGTSWRVGIRDPFGTANEYFAALTVGERFLSTSGSYEKQFTENGKTYHHILDLTTGYPAETQLVSVTIVAQTGLQSDALSTLCFLLGEEDSREVLELYNAQAVFVYADRTVSATASLRGSVELVNDAYTWR